MIQSMNLFILFLIYLLEVKHFFLTDILLTWFKNTGKKKPTDKHHKLSAQSSSQICSRFQTKKLKSECKSHAQLQMTSCLILSRCHLYNLPHYVIVRSLAQPDRIINQWTILPDSIFLVKSWDHWRRVLCHQLHQQFKNIL